MKASVLVIASGSRIARRRGMSTRSAIRAASSAAPWALGAASGKSLPPPVARTRRTARRQPAGASRERHGRFGRAAARPVGGASLRSEAAEGGVGAFGGGGGLQAQGEGGLAGAAFPAHDGEGFDRRRVEACSPAGLQACKPANLQGCTVSGLQPVRTTRQRTGRACGEKAAGRGPRAPETAPLPQPGSERPWLRASGRLKSGATVPA